MSADWTYLVADLRTGRIASELPLSNVQVSKVLNDSGRLTASWQLSTVGKYLGDPYTLTRPARTAIYAYRDGVPWWGGILWTSSYDSSTKVVSLGAADWWSYFDHRKVVPLLDTTDGMSAVASTQVAFTATDQNAVARGLVALAQTHTGGDIGITLDSSLSGTLIDRTYYGYSLSSMGDMLRELTGVIGGPDIRFDVGSPQDGTNKPARLMLVGTPKLGQQGSRHVFEYGGNLLGYTWPSDGSGMETRDYATGNGMEATTPIAIYEDLSLYDDGWPLLEGETGYDTVVDAPTLVAHAQGDQVAARLPLVTPTLVALGSVPPLVGQVGVGDNARLLIRDEFFTRGLDTTVRIVSIAISPGDTVEQVTYTTNPTLDDVA